MQTGLLSVSNILALTLAAALCFPSPSYPSEKIQSDRVTSETRPHVSKDVGGRTDYSQVIAKLQRDLPGLLEKNGVPGAAVALVDDQAVVWACGFGFTDRSVRRHVTADTLFSLQSVTKSYTATAFLMAVGQKKFTLDESLRSVLPWFRVHSRWGGAESDKVTFRHLLSHWAGLCHEAPIGNNYGDWQCTFDEHIRSIPDTWLKCRVGERFRYSNLGYDLIGDALQALRGQALRSTHARSAA